MASLKDLKNRISSVRSTQKITKAMQMVAAAKLRRAQEAAEAARPYAERMAAVMANLSTAMAGTPGASPLLVGTGRSDTYLLVVMTADRGLCGGFNTNIVKKARERITALQAEGKTVKLICVGKKGGDQLKRQFAKLIVERIELSGEKTVTSATSGRIGEKIRIMFENGEFDVCELVSAEFVSVISQKPRAKVLIPAIDAIDEGVERPDLKGAIYEAAPDGRLSQHGRDSAGAEI